MITNKFFVSLTILGFLSIIPVHAGVQDSGPAGKWQQYTDLGTAAFNHGDMKEAEKQFRAALYESEVLTPKNQAYVDGLINLGDVYNVMSNVEGAEETYGRAVDAAESYKQPIPALPLVFLTLGMFILPRKIIPKLNTITKNLWP